MRKKSYLARKKGQGLSLNTIIIAAIVLIVLIVLWFIFQGRTRQFGEGLTAQDEKTKQFEKDLAGIFSGKKCLPDSPCPNPTGASSNECKVDGCEIFSGNKCLHSCSTETVGSCPTPQCKEPPVT